MLNLKFVASIAERDIDLLIMEEMSVSCEFREWFSSRVFGEPVYQNEIGAWHSVCDAELGESDIVFIFGAVDEARTAVMIENKIDAPPQPEQGKRYQLRGEKGVKEGYWEKFKTCVVAPSKYLSSSKHSEHYDVEISYEEILAYFQSRRPRDNRFPYKARILLEAIEQNRRGYQPKYNEEMTRFVADYFMFSSMEYAGLTMQEAKPRPAGSTWISFHPESLPKGIELAHQLTRGMVNVFFNGQAEKFEILEEKYKDQIPDNASIRIAGKSVAIYIDVPKLNPLSKSFSSEKESVRLALEALSSLEKIVSSNENI